MGKASRDKGLRRERAIVDVHRKSGIHAERVPLSGALGYRGNDADVDLYVRGAAPVKAEVKARGDGAGFKTLLRWISTSASLFSIQRSRVLKPAPSPRALTSAFTGAAPRT